METETTTESEFLNEGKATEGQIQGSEEINKCKRAHCEGHNEGSE